MAPLIQQIIQKMGLNNEPKVLGYGKVLEDSPNTCLQLPFPYRKTTELLRLLELRSTNVNATLNEYAKTVLCIDLAAVFLGIQFDQV